MNPPRHHKTIVSRLTAELPSAIATIAVSGPQALEAVLKYAYVANGKPTVDRVYYAHWRLNGNTAQEQVVVCRTSEQTLEIHCHGGNAICRGILQDLCSAGCQLVAAADWRKLHNRLNKDACLIGEQAEEDLLRATTDRVAAILLDQMNGALEIALRCIVQALETGRVESAQSELTALLRWRSLGLHLVEPWRIVLAGPPNVGKSSLINAIAGSEKSIVHHEPGTTRDWIESQCAISGWPICMSDTAGIRESRDKIELAGIARAKQQILAADLLVAVVDATQGWTETHQTLAKACTDRQIPILVAWNKADIGSPAKDQLHRDLPDHLRAKILSSSTVGAPGIDELLATLPQMLVPESPPMGAPVPFRNMHFEALGAALGELDRNGFDHAVAILQALLKPLG